MRITMDILNSESGLGKDFRIFIKKDKILVYIKTVPLVCDDVEKKCLFFRTAEKRERQKLIG
jgi:hypothetical protein